MNFFNSWKKTKKKREILQEYYGEAKKLKKSLSENIKIIKDLLGNPNDLIIREILISEKGDKKLAVIVIDGLTNALFVHDFILKELMLAIRTTNLDDEIIKNTKFVNIIKNHSLPISDIDDLDDFKKLCEKLLSGDTIILFDGYNQGLVLDTKGWKDRGVSEPSAETVVRGARDSFNETIRTSTMLIRRRIKDINLRIDNQIIGEVTRTNISVVYIEGIANEKIINDVKKRLEAITIDGILESGYLEELLINEPYSLFPIMYTTERPDKVCANLLEGRIAILTDGTPFVLIVPAVFIQFFQSTEDYFQRSIFSSFIRLIRFLSFFLALLTPALYIAITTFHQEMLPTNLIISISGQRESVPFPALIEVLFMELTFEILREAGLRMPRAIGQAISIVGALVLGEAAVNAGIVSTIMIIIVSITAITSLIFPEYNFSNPIRLLRFIFIILSAAFGLYGIALGLMFLTTHLCSLKSFGIPYMYPLAPFNFKAMKDTFIRAPINTQLRRPSIFVEDDLVKQNKNNEVIKQTSKKGSELESEN